MLSLGYKPDAFINAYPHGSVVGVRVTYAVEPDPLDTAGAIRFAADHAGIGETFVAVNGDVLTDADFGALVDFHRARSAEATIALTPVDDPSVFGVVPTDESGRVTAFIEKPPREEAPTNLINAGIYVLEPSVLDRIPTGRPGVHRAGDLPRPGRGGHAVRAGLRRLLVGHRHPRRLPPGPLRPPRRDAVRGRRRRRPSSTRPSGQGSGGSGRCRWPAPASPTSLLGRGAVVSEHATVTNSVVGHGAVVEEGASIADSVLLPGARVAQSASVEGSIIGPDAIVGQRCAIRALSVVGAGAVTASGTVVDGERVTAGV